MLCLIFNFDNFDNFFVYLLHIENFKFIEIFVDLFIAIEI